MSDVDDLARERTGVSRRTLVRAGAHAAWVVPAVTVISSAPAVAASNPGAGTLAFTSGTYTASWSKVQHNNGQSTTTYSYPFTTGSIGIKNTSTGTAIAKGGTLQITVTFATSGAVVAPIARPSNALPSGWSVSPATGNASTFVFTYANDLAPGATATLGALTFGTSSTPDAVVSSSAPPKESATLTGNATVSQNSSSFNPATPATFTSSN